MYYAERINKKILEWPFGYINIDTLDHGDRKQIQLLLKSEDSTKMYQNRLKSDTELPTLSFSLK